MAKINNIDPMNPEAAIREIGEPSNSREHIFLGEAYFYLGEYSKAADELSLGLQLEAERTVLTTATVEQLVVAYAASGKLNEARQVAVHFGHLVDRDSLPRLRMFESTGQWPEGITDDFVQFASMIWLKTLVGGQGEKRPDLAEKLALTLYKLSPTNPSVCFCLALSYLLQDKLPDAIDMFSRCIELTPNANEVLIGRALAYKRTGNLRECLKDVEQIRKINGDTPDTSKFLNQLGLDL